jgi:hypothetical protein
MLLRIRVKSWREFRSKGHSLLEAIQLAKNLIDDDVVDTALMLSSAELRSAVQAINEAGPSDEVRGAGDGSFIRIIEDFLNSDLGKMLIALIMSLIGV